MHTFYTLYLTLSLLIVTNTFAQTQTKFLTDNGSPIDLFGSAIDIDGNLAIIGAPEDDDKASNAGAAYIFEQDDSGWSEVVKLTPSNGEIIARFGNDVAINNLYAVVGAPGSNIKGTQSGAVYVFEKQGSSWEEVAIITARDGEGADFFGFSVAIADNYIYVGASDGDGLIEYTGAVYVFERINGEWFEIDKLIANNGAFDDGFGTSISVYNGDVLVGADGVDEMGDQTGAAYFFQRSDGPAHSLQFDGVDDFVSITNSSVNQVTGDLTLEAWIKLDSYPTSGFYNVLGNQINGETEDTNVLFLIGINQDGTLNAFHESGSGTNHLVTSMGTVPLNTWTHIAQVRDVANMTYQWYINGVAEPPVAYEANPTGGENAVLRFGSGDGASFFHGAIDEIRMWNRQLSAEELREGQFLRLRLQDQLGLFGYWRMDEGTGPIIDNQSNPFDGNVGTATWLNEGRPDGAMWTQVDRIRSADGIAREGFGFDVQLYGNVAIVGARLNDEAGLDAGAAYLFERQGNTWTQIQKLIPQPDSTRELFGYSVDINDEMAIVGARDDVENGQVTGAAYIYQKTDSGWQWIGKLTASDAMGFDQFGVAVAIQEETALVGAPTALEAGVPSGAVYAFDLAPVSPTITSAPLTNATIDSAYIYQVESAGFPMPDYELSTAPSGMTIDSETGRVSWTPSALGTFEVSILASNGTPPDASQSFSIAVTGSAPVITSTPFTMVTANEPYMYNVEATGNPAVTFSLSSAPDGMAIDATTGVITWTPTVTGTYAITIIARNGVSPDATQSYELTVLSGVNNEQDTLPLTFEVSPVYPNPFSNHTVLSYSIPQSGSVQISVFDALGRFVHMVEDLNKPAGRYQVTWDGRSQGHRVPAGVYYMRILLPSGVQKTVSITKVD